MPEFEAIVDRCVSDLAAEAFSRRTAAVAGEPSMRRLELVPRHPTASRIAIEVDESVGRAWIAFGLDTRLESPPADLGVVEMVVRATIVGGLMETTVERAGQIVGSRATWTLGERHHRASRNFRRRLRRGERFSDTNWEAYDRPG